MTHDVVIMRLTYKHSGAYDKFYLRKGKFYHDDKGLSMKTTEVSPETVEEEVKKALERELNEETTCSLYITQNWMYVIRQREVW